MPRLLLWYLARASDARRSHVCRRAFRNLGHPGARQESARSGRCQHHTVAINDLTAPDGHDRAAPKAPALEWGPGVLAQQILSPHIPSLLGIPQDEIRISANSNTPLSGIEPKNAR